MPGKVPMTYETNPMFRKAMASMGSEVRSVRSDVDFLTDKLMDLGMSVDGLVAISPEPGDGGGFDNDVPQSASDSVDGDERAFEVFGVEFDDSGNQVSPISKWTVYVPSGCVQIDGVAVKFDNEVSEDRVSVSPDVKGGITLYCVVWKDKDGTAHAKICVGDSERGDLTGNIGSNGGTLYASVPFCTLSDTYEDNNQIHLGVIALTSSTALAGDPCRVVSIGDGTVPGSTLSDNGLKVVKDAYVEVEYTKAGDCPGEGEVGHDDCKFTIPIIIPDGQGGTGDVTVYGTDNSHATGSVLRIVSDDETNLTCTVSQGQNNEVVLTFGIRYV